MSSEHCPKLSRLAIRRLRLTLAPVSFRTPRGTHTLGYVRRDKGRTYPDSCRSDTAILAYQNETPWSLSFTFRELRSTQDISLRTNENERTQSLQRARIDSNLNLVISLERKGRLCCSFVVTACPAVRNGSPWMDSYGGSRWLVASVAGTSIASCEMAKGGQGVEGIQCNSAARASVGRPVPAQQSSGGRRLPEQQQVSPDAVVGRAIVWPSCGEVSTNCWETLQVQRWTGCDPPRRRRRRCLQSER